MSRMYAPKAGTKIGDLLQGTVFVMGKLTKIENGVGTVTYYDWDVSTQQGANKDYSFAMPADANVAVGDVVTVVAYAERGKGNVAEKIMNKGTYVVNNPVTGEPVLLIVMGIAGRKYVQSGSDWVASPIVFSAQDIPAKTVQSKTTGKEYNFPAHQEFGVYLKQDQTGALTESVKFVDYVGEKGNDHAAGNAATKYAGYAQPNNRGEIPLLTAVMTAIVDIRDPKNRTPYTKTSSYNNLDQTTNYWSGKIRSFDYSWGDNSIDTVFEKAEFNRTPGTQTQQTGQTNQQVAQPPVQQAAPQQQVAQAAPSQPVIPPGQDITSEEFLGDAALVEELPFA